MGKNKHKKKHESVKGGHGVAFPHVEEPRIVFDQTAYHKIMHWVLKCPDEISGLGKVLRQEDGSFLVQEVMLLDQQNTGSSTEIDAQAIAKAMYVLKDTPGDLNFWWHSHVNFDVFWSKTDTDTLQELSQHGWFIASVFNKRYEQKNAFACNIALGGDASQRLKIFLDDIGHTTRTFLPKEVFEQWDADYDKHVKKKFTPAPVYRGKAHVWNPGDYYSVDREPSQWDIEKGYMWRFDPIDGWFKEVLDKEGLPLSLVKSLPGWVSAQEEKEQLEVFGKKKAPTAHPRFAGPLSIVEGGEEAISLDEDDWDERLMEHFLSRRE